MNYDIVNLCFDFDLGLIKDLREAKKLTTKNTKIAKKRNELGLIFEAFVFFVVKK